MKIFVLVLAHIFLVSQLAQARSAKRFIESPSPSPSPTPVMSQPGLKRIHVMCDETCTDAQRKELDQVVLKMIEVEGSDCFKQKLKAEPRLLETKKSNSEVADDITSRAFTSTLTIWRPGYWELLKGAWKACGKEIGDHLIYAKESCYESMDRCGKGSLIAHELSHDPGGYTHFTAGNRAAGNENTVPYRINAAFEACCK